MTSSQNIKTSNVNVDKQNIMGKVNVDVVTTENGEQKPEKLTMPRTEKNLVPTRENTTAKTTRNPHRIIYTSSYDRGLQHLLKMWPDVRKEVPDAELHIFYGWQLFENFYKDNPGAMMWMSNMNKMMEHEGIVHHGRIAQPDLIEELKKSGIWAYPTHFDEINCISALKAQAYGCEPVVVNLAALKETVQFGRKVEGSIYDEKTKEEFKKELIGALKNPMSEFKRKEMMEWAKKYEWRKIANNWEVLLNG